ncbi:MAG: ABC transporter permease [Bacteroidota bacterium]
MKKEEWNDGELESTMKSKMLIVAKREYLENVRSKAFLISLVLTPLIMIAFGLLPSYFASKSNSTPIIIGVVDETHWITEELQSHLNKHYTLAGKQPMYILRPIIAASKEEAIFISDSLVENEIAEGTLLLQKNIESDSIINFRTKRTGNFRLINALEKSLDEIFRNKLYSDLQISVLVQKKFSLQRTVTPIKITRGEDEQAADFKTQFFTSYIFVMLMFMLILTTGQMLVRSVVEEKSNRIVEVLLSSCSASDLMRGKILGLSALGITQIALWLILGISFVPSIAVMLFQSEGILLMPIYFILGYLLYASLFVGIGSIVTTEQEAQQLTSYISLLLISPIVISLNAIENPHTPLMQILSYIPLLTPTMMALRISVEMPPFLEIVVTSFLLFISTLALMWASGKIFHIGILSTGKRMTLKEIVANIRT